MLVFVLVVFFAEDLSATAADAAEDDAAKVVAFDFGAPDAAVLVILDFDFVF